MQVTSESECITDHEMLETAFGNGYFIFHRIKNKILLTPKQKHNLLNLIEERNHLEILWFVNELRNNVSSMQKQIN